MPGAKLAEGGGELAVEVGFITHDATWPVMGVESSRAGSACKRWSWRRS